MPLLLILTFLLTPAYAINFKFGELPTNILMLWVVLVWLIFFIWLLVKNQMSQFLAAAKNCDRKILIFTALFFLSGIISLFINGIDRAKLGQFIVLFLQPISIFFIARFMFDRRPKSKYIILNTIYIILAAAGLYAALQYFALIGLPAVYQGNSVEPKRSLSFFLHPNFYALWSAPLLALLVPDVMQKLRNWKLKIGNWKFITAWIIGALGLGLSFSRAGWLGLAAAIGVYLIVAADAKIRKLMVVIGIIGIVIVAAIPNLRWRFILPFYGEKSAVSRLSLWHTGTKAIKESPVTGLGLTGFANNWNRLNTDPNLETHNFPHNIFLNFWVETGLLGLLSFLGLSSLLIYRGLRSSPPLPLGEGRGEGSQAIKLAVALFLICLISQGLIDNPYFKNDLAMVFWMALALGI